MRRRVTIQDIALHSDTSVTTVSMVLRDKPGIGAETRRRVLAAARELGYHRRLPATDQGAVRSVAMILRARTGSPHEQVPAVNPFYSDVISGIETAARRERINLLYATLAVDVANVPYEMPDHLLQQELDGILLIGSFSAETVEAIARDRSAPTVLVDAPAQPSPHDAVVTDNEGGARLATTHLIGLGHRHIALAGPDLDADPNFRQRREGYRRALAEHGLQPRYFTSRSQGMHAVGEAAVEALQASPEITAVVAANDASAIEVMRGVQQLGRRVPEELSIVGFDDIARAQEVRPRLTTMAVDRVTMGRQAVRMLQYRLAWPDACRLMTMLQPELRQRESTAPPPGSDTGNAPAMAPATAPT
jgi:DNA-binding LacI/PurR family transcriptional regulator